MRAEDRIFQRRRFDRGKLEAYGFTADDGNYSLTKSFMNGDFAAEFNISADGSISCKVIDVMNDEEYTRLHNPNYYGSYVNTVRDEYEKLLLEIADSCCTELLFASDQSNRIADAVLAEFGVIPDFPWDDDRYRSAGVFRHADSGKWFGLIMNIRRSLLEPGRGDETIDVINLKTEESDAAELHRESGIFPAYHMNHRTWISVLLDDTLTDGRIMELVRQSYRLTGKKQGTIDDDMIRKVLAIADSVPYGRVAAYGQIAEMAGLKNGARMAGKIMSMADRYGDHPCHRIVNSSGRTVPGWQEQRQLLEAEGIGFLKNGNVDMKTFQWRPGDMHERDK